MCTEKQKEYITKLTGWKDVSIERSVVESMTEAEASEYIDELKALPSVKKDDRKTTKADKGFDDTARRIDAAVKKKNPELYNRLTQNDFNPVQMGMVKKVVAASVTGKYWGSNPQEFAETCLSLYMAFERADEVVKKEVSL